MDVSDLLAITLKEKLKIKVAKWGITKKNIYKKTVSELLLFTILIFLCY
jgi:hypothetical protein